MMAEKKGNSIIIINLNSQPGIGGQQIVRRRTKFSSDPLRGFALTCFDLIACGRITDLSVSLISPYMLFVLPCPGP